MARNPKDLVVSYYQFHRSLRTMSYRGTFQEFCRRFMNDKCKNRLSMLDVIYMTVFMFCFIYLFFFNPPSSRTISFSLPLVAYGSWFEHVQEFWEHRLDSNILFLKYEDMFKVKLCLSLS